MYEIIHYLDESENDLYQNWLDSLRDRVAKVAIIRRVARMEAGLFGDCKPLRGVLPAWKRACLATASLCAMVCGNRRQ